MIGAEAIIAEAYHALKAGDLDRTIALLDGLPHPRAKTLLQQAQTLKARSKERD